MAAKDSSIVILEDNEKLMKTYEHISQAYWVELRDVIAMKNVAFPDIDAQHFMIAMSIAKKYDLDPSIKEIYGWEKGWRITIVASNAWFLKIARRQEWYLKIVSSAVFPEDEFEMDMLNDEIKKHIIHPEKRTKDSIPLGAYAILKMKDQPDQMKWVDWNEYVQPGDYSPWRKQRSAMITKCATSILCREAFWLSGLYDEGEMEPQESALKKAAKRLAEMKEGPTEEATIEEQVIPKPIEEVSVEQWVYVSRIKEYFTQCTEEWITPLIPTPTFEFYSEAQAKKDFITISQYGN